MTKGYCPNDYNKEMFTMLRSVRELVTKLAILGDVD